MAQSGWWCADCLGRCRGFALSREGCSGGAVYRAGFLIVRNLGSPGAKRNTEDGQAGSRDENMSASPPDLRSKNSSRNLTGGFAVTEQGLLSWVAKTVLQLAFPGCGFVPKYGFGGSRGEFRYAGTSRHT